MTKQHFIALADDIRYHNSFDFNEPFTTGQLLMLAKFCKRQNSRFMEDRWLSYIAGKCGKSGGKVKAAA